MLSEKQIEAMDPNILVGMVNMKLRNQFANLSALARYYELNESELKNKLAEGGFEYLPGPNQFR